VNSNFLKPQLCWSHFVLKLSGFFLGGGQQGFIKERFLHIATQLKNLVDLGARITVVVGGGNILRGSEQQNSTLYTLLSDNLPLKRTLSDRMGMLATCLNGFQLQTACLEVGLPLPHMVSSIPIGGWIDTDMKDAIHHLNKAPGILICVGGAGLPFLSTDTVSVIRALEWGVPFLLKATQVSGVFDKDPLKNPDAIHYPHLSYQELIQRNLHVIDTEACILAQKHSVNIIIFRCEETIPSLWKIMTGSDIQCTVIQ
jgi:uridylate kinase